MRVRANRAFYDRVAGVLRKAGDVFEVTEERAEQLGSAHPDLITALDAEPEVQEQAIQKQPKKRGKHGADR